MEYWCANCKLPTSLDQHGRCERCESEAVDILVPPSQRCVPNVLNTERIAHK